MGKEGFCLLKYKGMLQHRDHLVWYLQRYLPSPIVEKLKKEIMQRERHSYQLCAKPFLTDIKVKKPRVIKAVGLLIQQKQQKHLVVTFDFSIW